MRATQIMTIGLFGAFPWAAYAGELGTSRGSVSISVTVPPHVTATTVSPVSQDRPIRSKLCVATNGLREYHLMLVDAASPQGRSIPKPVRGGSMEAICRGSETGYQIFGKEPSAQSEHNAALSLTLLVVPD